MVSSFYVYVLECSDGTLYTGYTNNLKRRLDVHNSGKGAKYTRARLPCKLVYSDNILVLKNLTVIIDIYIIF